MWYTLQRVAASILPCVLLVATGCGEKTGVPLYRTTGKLLIDGKPPNPRITLLFMPVTPPVGGAAPQPYAITDENGAFSVSTIKTDDGAPAGDYVVTLQAPGPEKSRGKAVEKPAPAQFAVKYKDPKTSTFKVTIQPRKTDLGTIEIEPASASLSPNGKQ